MRNLILLFVFFSSEVFSECKSLNSEDVISKKYFDINYSVLRGDYKVVDSELHNLDDYYSNYSKGYVYLLGRNKIKNYELAEQFLKKSAKYCFSPAHYSLGYMYYIKNDLAQAKIWFESAKALGDNLAAHQMAIIYKKENNSEKMLENLLFADSNGFTPSITELGVVYYDGALVKKDLKKAFDYFERAALRNDPLAQNNLGWMYEHGEGTETNLEKAEYWYRMASENSFSLAFENLERLNSIINKRNKASF